MECLHCGKVKGYSHQGYCEDCFQDLISENFKLQTKVKELEKELYLYRHNFNENARGKHFKDEDIYYHIPRIDINL